MAKKCQREPEFQQISLKFAEKKVFESIVCKSIWSRRTFLRDLEMNKKSEYRLLKRRLGTGILVQQVNPLLVTLASTI